MREILFRGKLTDDSKWVYGCLLDKIYGAVPAIMSEQSVDDAFNLEFEYDHVQEKTVGQYTGMKDKNGRRIFEGDICKVGNLIYKVVFEYSCWWFKILSNKVYCCPAFNSHCGEYCEIIGNIHDNPELLENP